jgi:hypothetical protein
MARVYDSINQALPDEVQEVCKEARKSRRKFKHIYSLPAKVRANLESMLFAGIPVRTAALYLRDNGYLNHLTYNTVFLMLNDYRRYVLSGMLALDQIEKGTKNKLATTYGRGITAPLSVVKRFGRYIDAHATLNELVEVQIYRTNRALIHESKQDKINDGARKELEFLMKALGQLANLQLELGILQKIPKRPEDLELTIEDEEEPIDDVSEIVEKRKRIAQNVLHLLESVDDDEAE